ncbi:stage VI sporulation protein D [Alkalibacillus flavidus]|uniref:Stage VI sporulation protein D n=1 Tax=Alkalibacillus flavidus TaxID=546021 RepID=A0ABV2KSJ9_9BACI
MSYRENMPYQFDVQEHITFRHGEEIEDLYSIAIDPDVQVHHHQSTVQVRGVLVVHGDYLARQTTQEETVFVDQDQHTVQQVRALDNGFMEFQYPIPVDISIPYERVKLEEDVQVAVDYFDYELPEPRTLKVYTTIRLDGAVMIDVEQDDITDDSNTNDFELKQFPAIEDEVQHDDDSQSVTNTEPSQPGRDIWPKEKSTSFQDFFQTESNEPSQSVSNTHGTDDEPSEDYDTSDDSIEDSSDEVEEEDASTVKKGLNYLSKFFREEQDETQVQMRVRFVQANETLETIADAYHLTTHQLERLNNLESSSQLQEGDVLLVPAKSYSTD